MKYGTFKRTYPFSNEHTQILLHSRNEGWRGLCLPIYTISQGALFSESKPLPRTKNTPHLKNSVKILSTRVKWSMQHPHISTLLREPTYGARVWNNDTDTDFQQQQAKNEEFSVIKVNTGCRTKNCTTTKLSMSRQKIDFQTRFLGFWISIWSVTRI